jgi:uncharacterized protein YciI
MLVQFNCLDKNPAKQELRSQHLAAHLAWVDTQMAHICVAGPLRHNGVIIGSMYVLEAQDIEQAQGILHSDPYYLADIWLSIDLYEFNAYAGGWVGGKNWSTQNSTQK